MAMLKRPDLSVGCRYVPSSFPSLPPDGITKLITRRELQHMLHLDRKAEIQILSSIREEGESLESIYMDDHHRGEVKVSGLLGYVMDRLRASVGGV